MRDRLTARRGWLLLAVAVTAYELVADEHELLSRGVDRARAVHPVADAMVTATVIATAGHLLRWWPQQFDPIAALVKLRGLAVLRRLAPTLP